MARDMNSHGRPVKNSEENVLGNRRETVVAFKHVARVMHMIRLGREVFFID